MATQEEIQAELVSSLAEIQAAQDAIGDIREELAGDLGLARNALPKSGGEMMGNIILLDGAQLRVDSSSMERGVTPTSSIIQSMVVRDKNGLMIGGQEIGQSSGGYDLARLFLMQNGNHYLGLYADHEGGAVYASCPPPRGLYNNDIATFKSVVVYGLKKLPDNQVIHIDAVNGSDTAGLNDGRGFSADMPFKSLQAARNWVAMNCCGRIVNFQLHSDITLTGGLEISCMHFMAVKLLSDSTKRTINFASDGYLSSNGGVALSNLIFNAQNTPRLLYSNGQYVQSCLYLDAGLEFNGSVSVSGTVVNVTNGARAICSPAFTTAGNITGKKYICNNGALLIGASKIPGTEAGTCDASSNAID